MRLRSAIVVSLVGLVVVFGVVLVSVARTPSGTRPTADPSRPAKANVAATQLPTAADSRR